MTLCVGKYSKIYNIRRSKSLNLSDCRLDLQVPLVNPLKSGVKFSMEILLEQLLLRDQQCYCNSGASYIRCLTVLVLVIACCQQRRTITPNIKNLFNDNMERKQRRLSKYL